MASRPSPSPSPANHDEGDYGPDPDHALLEETTCDAQFVHDENNKLIIKEFAVYLPGFGIDGYRVVTFAPPYEKEHLPLKVVKQNNYAAANIHGLEWNDGEIAYRDIFYIMWTMTYQFKVLYAKGTEKTKILQTYLPHLRVINIESLGCPAFEKLPLFDAVCVNEIHCKLGWILNSDPPFFWAEWNLEDTGT